MTEKKPDFWKLDDWSRKLKQQASESKEYRDKLYKKVDLKNKKNILDVGCGTGVITEDIASLTNGCVTGIDIDDEKLDLAKKLLTDVKNIKLMKADAIDLPFDDGTFDLVVFNIVLIYIKNQQRALNEMARVTTKNGIILATLEPDYAGRIDYPENPIADLFLESIAELGADIYTGRKLRVLFNKAGLKTEVGIDTETEYILIRDDKKRLKMFDKDRWVYEKLLEKAGWSTEQIEEYCKSERDLTKNGLNFKFAPSFYAIGRKVK
jgi:ubiquinone/menaquinone biosynthesis C-methylase UbiE